MIKNIKDLESIQILCKSEENVKNCLNLLKELGFNVINHNSNFKVICYSTFTNAFENGTILDWNRENELFDKNFIKILKKLINKKEEEKVKDIEVAEDGRIIKINNWESEKCLYFIGAWDYGTINFDDFKREGFEYYVNLGLAFISREARDKAMFKLETEVKLKNIAERLNAGRKIDWKDRNQEKIYIYYDCDDKILNYYEGYYSKNQGAIYCLDKHFLDVAVKEIGEENLIKYFKE